MKMIKLVCPYCGATLSVEGGIDSFYCQFCGGKILLQGQDKNTIDAKVKLKEFEHIERLKDRELEQANYKINKKEKETKMGIKVIFGFFIFFFLVGLIIKGFDFVSKRKEEKEHKAASDRLYAIEERVGIEIDERNYEKALFYANQLYSDYYGDEQTWNSKRENYISMIKNAQRNEKLTDLNIVFMPASSDEFIGKNCSAIVEYLTTVGFTKVSTQKSIEAASATHPENTVDHILIGGKTSFTTEDYFEKDTPIIVYYYSK